MDSIEKEKKRGEESKRNIISKKNWEDTQTDGQTPMDTQTAW
jgi:hypothetical protein